MTIAFVNQAEFSTASSSTNASCTSALTLAAGDVVEVSIYGGANLVFVVSDGLGNSYVSQQTSATLPGSNAQFTVVAQNCAAGSATINVTSSTGAFFAIYAKQISGADTTGAAIVGKNINYQAGGPGSGANVVVSGTVTISSATNVLVSGFTNNFQFGTPVATAGTSPLAFTGRTAVWSVLGGGTAFSVPEDLRVVSATGTVQATYGVVGGGAQFDNVVTSVVVYAEAAPSNAPAFVGQVQVSSATALSSLSAPSITPSLAGDSLVVYVLSSGTASFTVTDSAGNTYNFVSGTATSGTTHLNGYLAQNVKGVSTVVNVGTTGAHVLGIIVANYTKVAKSGSALNLPFGAPFNAQVGPGSVQPNVITSGVAQISQPAILVGLTVDVAALGACTAGTSPTAFTGHTPVWSTYGAGVACAVLEDALITASAAATFGTITANQSSSFMTMVMALGYPAIPGGPTPRVKFILP